MELGSMNLCDRIKDLRDDCLLFGEDEIRTQMHSILNAVNHIHRCGFLHWDLKPENIMFVGNELKLVDFGTVKNLEKEKLRLEWGEITRIQLSDYVSTRWYWSPECILKVPDYGAPADVFALGCIMAEMFRLRPLFTGKNAAD